MADNLLRIDIGKDWVDLNSQSGLAVGTNLKIQNVATVMIDIAVSLATPTTDVGEITVPYEFIAAGDGETSAVWAKTSGMQGGGKLSVQDNT